MQIEKQNGNRNINISEMGFKLELNTGLLFKTLISETSLELLNKSIKNRLEELIQEFNFLDYNLIRKDKYCRIEIIYEYACLLRDFGSICSDIFEEFYDENNNTMEQVGSIYKYNPLYGFKLSETIKIP